MRREKETDGLRFERVKSLFLSWLLDLDLDLCNLFFSINVPLYTHKIISGTYVHSFRQKDVGMHPSNAESTEYNYENPCIISSDYSLID